MNFEEITRNSPEKEKVVDFITIELDIKCTKECIAKLLDKAARNRSNFKGIIMNCGFTENDADLIKERLIERKIETTSRPPSKITFAQIREIQRLTDILLEHMKDTNLLKQGIPVLKQDNAFLDVIYEILLNFWIDNVRYHGRNVA